MGITFRPERIRTLRDDRGITLDEMAAKIGKPKQLVSVWENGVNAPTLENLLLICNTFHVGTDFFLVEG